MHRMALNQCNTLQLFLLALKLCSVCKYLIQFPPINKD